VLLQRGYKVQVETNGTLFVRGIPENMKVVCAPKTSSVNSNWRNRVDDWKYVLEEGKVDPDDGLPTSVLGMPTRPFRPPIQIQRDHIWVQPMDSGDEARNKINLEAAVESCMKYGYRLSLQTHKIAGLP
jgi:7-carboxy-7-deazaguanine synthase